jgi:hypothetical protein
MRTAHRHGVNKKRERVIDVEQIKINLRIPSNEVRIVAMQPFLRFHSATEEPFRWSNEAVDMQLAAIHRTLDIARRDFGGLVANFTLFPEYAIPGIAGASIINDRISADEWPNESIIIAGVQGITKAEYRGLCDLLTAHVSQSNAPNSVPDNKWVNCCIIWVKDREGVVEKWVQPKVRPAWSEMSVTCNDMFSGSKVYVFECQYEPSGYPCRIFTLICFDWVASVAGTTVCDELIEKLTELSVSNPLDLVFVIQHNSSPNHSSFLNSTYKFLTDVSHPFVERDKAIVVHANTAVSPLPSRTGLGGFSACVFSPSAQFDSGCCRPTVCMHPISLRESNILKRCKDVVFREMGECIHAFTVRIPRFVTPDVTDRTYPLPWAHVHATDNRVDPRLSGGPISAAVKWLSDSLDYVERLSATALLGLPLKAYAETIEPAIIAGMRKSDGRAAFNSVNWATCSFSHGNESRDDKRRLDADLWEAPEKSAIEIVLHSLTSLGIAYSLDFDGALLHSAVQGEDGFVQVVAIRGDTHQDCRLHYDRLIPQSETDPVLVITCDRDNFVPTIEEYLRLDESVGDRSLAFIDYQTLITNCRNAMDIDNLKRYLDGILPRHGRII